MSTTLTPQAVAERRQKQVVPDRVMFRVSGLYGLAPQGGTLPVGGGRTVHSGPVALMADPDADPSCNTGIVDFKNNTLKVRYGAHAVFPGLYDLVAAGNHDPGLLTPVRLIATDECELTPGAMGWRALGCLDFLPGSVWSGAAGG